MVVMLPSSYLNLESDKVYIIDIKNGIVNEMLSNKMLPKCYMDDLKICGTSGKVANLQDLTTPPTNVPTQWALSKIELDNLSRLGANGEGITIAVIDTGVESNHSDLEGVVLPGYDAISDTYGVISDSNGHGTHVAGIIAAKNDGHGVEGLAPSVKILPIKALDANGNGEEKDVAKGILWAVSQGADIINLSLGGDQDNTILRDAVAKAISNGVVVVASSGNDGAFFNKINYPASLPGVVAVTATDPNDTVAYFSNTGDYIDLAAPGVFIKSTWINNSYREESGTSMAAPYVSASIAIIASYLKINASSAIEFLTKSATDIETEGFDTKSGYGLIDPYALLTNKYPRTKSERFKIENANLPKLPEFKLIWPKLPNMEVPTLTPYPLPKITPFPKAPISPERELPSQSKESRSKKENDIKVTDKRARTYFNITVSKKNSYVEYTLQLRTTERTLPLRKINVSLDGSNKTSTTDNLGKHILRVKYSQRAKVWYSGESNYLATSISLNPKSLAKG